MTIPAELPQGPGYEELLGIPISVITQLERLRVDAWEGRLGSADEWEEEHAALLDGHLVDVERLRALSEALRPIWRQDRDGWVLRMIHELNILLPPSAAEEPLPLPAVAQLADE
jgi:hypothetical protein